MKLNKTAIAALTAAASSSCMPVRGFSLNGPFNSHKVVATAFPKASRIRGISTSTALPMVFDKIFSSIGGGGGGGYSSKIDYSVIPYPVPELAAIAMEDKVPEEMVRNGKTYKLATFAGGCFWGLELAYQRVPGVEYTAVGYTHGAEKEPTYSAVCAG
jgi:hypothetical protein